MSTRTGAPTLASLLGSQVDAFQTALHAPQQPTQNGRVTPAATPTLGPQQAPHGSSGKKKARTSPNGASLPTPFTHTIRQPSLLTSLLTPAAAAATPPVVGLVTSLDRAHSLLAQLLPKEIEDTPPADEFHALFMQYLDACAGTAAATPAGMPQAADDKKKKRKRADEKETPASSTSTRAAHSALHTVSTTVIGRLAARCIALLARDDSTPEVAFDEKLLQSPSSYWSVLWLLLRSDSLSARFTPSLFPLLTRHAALPMIECALVHLHDASERDLVEVAKYALDNLPQPSLSERAPELSLDLLGGVKPAEPPTKKRRRKSARAMVHTANALNEPVKVVEVPGGPFAVILDLLLTSPVSANFLRHSLGALGPSHAHKLLLYLYAWTLRYWFHTESEVHQVLHQISKADAAAAATPASAEPPKGSKFRIPSFSQVIDWMNILLDAIDFMRVHQKEEARAAKEGEAATATATDATTPLSLADLVGSLASHISHHHLQFLERSQDLKGFIAIFAQLKRQPNAMPLPQAPMMDYAVEVLELGA